MNYFKQPLDYTQELKRKGIRGRRKAMAFKDYLEDVEMGDFNSERFYAEAWSVSKTAARNWIAEFKEEIDRFLGYWQLKNNEHYSSVKKQSDQSDQNKVTKEMSCNDGVHEENINTSDQSDQTEVTKAFNYNNNTNNASALFEGFYFIYRQFNTYAGSKREAKEVFINVDDVSHINLSRASILYLKDESVDKKVGAKKFLDNKIYLNYLDLHIKVLIEDVWVSGTYDVSKEVFTSSDGKDSKLTAMRIAERIGNHEIEFIKEVA